MKKVMMLQILTHQLQYRILKEFKSKKQIESQQGRKGNQSQDYEGKVNKCTVLSSFFAGGFSVEEPRSYEEAKGCTKWEKAMEEEIEALDKNETWERVPKPESCEPVTCKWLFRLKKK